MSSPQEHSTRRRVLVGLELLVVGAILGIVGALAVTSRSGSAEQVAELTSTQPTSTQVSLDCSIYDAPSLESSTAPRSTLVDGSPYVIVCEDPAGREAVNQLFIHRAGG